MAGRSVKRTQATCKYCGRSLAGAAAKHQFLWYGLRVPAFGRDLEVLVCGAGPTYDVCQQKAQADGYTAQYVTRPRKPPQLKEYTP